MKGKKQHDGSHDETTSIVQLMSIQPDSQDQETLLMFYGRQLGVTVDRTPKCHPQLAGGGIEYAWGAAKLYYRKQPLKEKRIKSVYQELVKRSLSNEILSLQFMRQCSRPSSPQPAAKGFYTVYQKRLMNEGNRESATYIILECITQFPRQEQAQIVQVGFLNWVFSLFEYPSMMDEKLMVALEAQNKIVSVALEIKIVWSCFDQCS